MRASPRCWRQRSCCSGATDPIGATTLGQLRGQRLGGKTTGCDLAAAVLGDGPRQPIDIWGRWDGESANRAVADRSLECFELCRRAEPSRRRWWRRGCLREPGVCGRRVANAVHDGERRFDYRGGFRSSLRKYKTRLARNVTISRGQRTSRASIWTDQRCAAVQFSRKDKEGAGRIGGGAAYRKQSQAT